ncbi:MULTISPECIES: hypothetical protein [Clostridium]|uniref:DUF5105 domain-containing protein n=1 Tax=Clostridium cibarium TaxID=2762247 RepID=A0ABR8PW08_9CLOT|nr:MULTISPECIES: hypothetical protein [Clostridium]MBD7912372.1 hypothetical protein [Clostridium cibarium]
MKNKVKKIIATICIVTLSAPLIACGGQDKKAPEEVVKTYIGTYLKSKDVNYEKTKVDKDTAEDLANKRDYNLVVTFNLDGEDMEGDFVKALHSALSKVKYNVTSSEVDKAKAKVSLEIEGINLDDVEKDGLGKLKEEKKKKTMNVEESMNYLGKVVIDDLNDIKLDDSKTVELELNQDSNKVWTLTDDSISKLEAAITEKDSYERIKEKVPDNFKEVINQAS